MKIKLESNLTSANIDLSEYEYCSHANGRDAHWQLYRKVVDGKGKWVARHDNTGEIKEITYDQARGFEPIDDSPISRLSRDLGKVLMPRRESFYSENKDKLEHVKITSLQPGDLVLVKNGMYDVGIGKIIRTYEDYPSSELSRHGVSRLYCYDAEIIKPLNNSTEVGEQYSAVEYTNTILKLKDSNELTEAFTQKRDISLDDLKNAKYADSFMKDRASINIDNKTYVKVGENKWEHIPMIPSAYGGFYSDEEIYSKIEAASMPSVLTEASYGGAYDIEDDQFFTREDLNNLSEEIEYELVRNRNINADVTSSYIENGVAEVTIECEENEYTHKEKIDMRRIKKPNDLHLRYAKVFADAFENLIREYTKTESIQDDYNEDENTYWYGKYTNMKGQLKKIIVKIPTQNYDEADKEFEMSIPEPYTKYKLWGSFQRKDSYMGNQLPKEGYTYLTESSESCGFVPNPSDTQVPEWVKDSWSKVASELKNMYRGKYDVIELHNKRGDLCEIDIYLPQTIDIVASTCFDLDELDASSQEAFENNVKNIVVGKVQKFEKEHFGGK